MPLPDHVGSVVPSPVSKPLRAVAKAFRELQQARHEADYDVGRRFSRSEVEAMLTQAEQAFSQWRAHVTRPQKELYLASLLLWKQWRR